MPIKPENKKLYPKNWPEIRAEIKERANDKCELCGIKNHAIGYRWEGKFYQFKDGLIEMPGELFQLLLEKSIKGPKYIKIVCTVMHLDHDPRNNGTPGDRPNLKFGCQKCHNDFDRPHRMANAKQTRLLAKSK